MVAPISPRHRKAFLEALAETGNIRLAASQVWVSPDWCHKLRRRDAGFDAACRAAVAAARERLGLERPTPSPSHRFAAGPSLSLKGRGRGGPLHHAPHPPPLRGSSLSLKGRGLVVERGNGRVVQLKRSAGKRWTHETEQRFLAVLAGCCNVRLAAAELGLCVHTAYKRRRGDPGFAAAWDEAIEIGRCALESRIVENIDHHFDRELPEPEAPMRGVCIEDAIRLLRMYEKRDRERRKGDKRP